MRCTIGPPLTEAFGQARVASCCGDGGMAFPDSACREKSSWPQLLQGSCLSSRPFPLGLFAPLAVEARPRV